MEKNTTSTMRSRSYFKIAISVIVLLLVAVTAINFTLQAIIRAQLSNINDIEIKHLDLSLLRNRMILGEISVHPVNDSTYRAYIQKATISGLQLFSYISSHDLIVDQVLIEGANIDLNLDSPKQGKTTPSAQIPGIQTRESAIRQSTLHISKNGNEVATFNDLHVRVDQLNFTSIDSFQLEDLYISCGRSSVTLVNNPHKLFLGGAEYIKNEELLRIENLHYFSDISTKNWYHHVSPKQERIDLKIERLEFIRPDIHGLVQENRLATQKIEINNGVMDVFEDQRFPHCDTCYKPLLQQRFINSSQIVRVDTIQVKDCQIHYLSNEKHTSEQGEIQFNHLFASFYNLTNDRKVLAKEKTMYLDVVTHVFDVTKLALAFKFDMTSPKGDFSFNGSTREFSLSDLNQYLSPIKRVEVGSGRTSNIDFHVTSDDSLSRGLLEFSYQDLEVTFLNKKHQKRKFMSDLFNTLVVHKDNIKDRNFRTGVINFKRDTSRSIFNYMSKSVQTGIESSVFAKSLLPKKLKPIEK